MVSPSIHLRCSPHQVCIDRRPFLKLLASGSHMGHRIHVDSSAGELLPSLVR